MLAAAERDRVDEKCVYVGHGLDAETLLRVRASMRDLAEVASTYYEPISEAYLVRKQVEHLPERPLYVLGVIVRRPKVDPEEGAIIDQQLADKVVEAVDVPGDLRVLVLTGSKGAIVRAWQGVPGSRL